MPTRSRALARLAPTLILAIAASARGDRPADDLLRLVPPDAGATLVVEGLHDRARVVLEDPILDGLRRLPAVEAWRASAQGRRLRGLLIGLERASGVDLATLRDDLLGDAVVLTLRLGPTDPPDQARGMLLLRFRDPRVLRRLVEAANDAEKRAGRAIDETTRQHRETTYTVRSFRQDARPTEYYAILGDDTFAWTNSEDLIRGAIERRDGPAGLLEEPNFRRVRDRLSERAIASLFVDPRFVARLLAGDPSAIAPAGDRPEEFLRRNLGAVAYAGAALEWQDGPVLHLHEAIDPARLDEPLRRWAERLKGAEGPEPAGMPASALAVVAGRVDFLALYDLLLGLIPEADRDRADNLALLLRGLLLDQDPRTAILPRLGPAVLAFVDAPSSGWPAIVASLEIDARPGVAEAVDNALRTIFALHASYDGSRDDRLRIEIQAAAGLRLTTLTGARPRFAYAIGGGRLIAGNAPGAIEAFATAVESSEGRTRFQRFRSAYFRRASNFAFLDLRLGFEAADARREVLARRLRNREDLDHLLALIRLFEAAYATVRVDPGLAQAHQTLGLVGRDPGSNRGAPDPD